MRRLVRAAWHDIHHNVDPATRKMAR